MNPALSPSLPLSRNTHWRYPLPLSRISCWRYPYPAEAVGGTPLSLSPSQPIPPVALAVQASRQCQWRHPRKKPIPSVICYK